MQFSFFDSRALILTTYIVLMNCYGLSAYSVIKAVTFDEGTSV